MSEPAATRPERGHILVADDEPHIRRVLTTLLESAGFNVEPVSDGSQALALLLDPGVPCDLLLTDLMMPERTGLEVLEELSALGHRRGLPVVVLTAKGEDADREEALRLGAADFLTKPFSPKKLLARIVELLDAARA